MDRKVILSNEHDSIMIECKEKNINLSSLVCISPYDSKSKEWLIGLNMITTMKSALLMKQKKVAKDKNVQDFLIKVYKKDGERI